MTKKITLIIAIIFFVSLVLTVIFASLAFKDMYKTVTDIVNSTDIELTQVDFGEDLKKIVVYGYGNTDFLKTPSETAYFVSSPNSYYEYEITPVDEEGVVEVYVYYKDYQDFSLTEEYFASQISYIMNSGYSSTFYVPDSVEIERRELHQDINWVHDDTETSELNEETEQSSNEVAPAVG